MEPQTNNASAKIITALIIGLLVGFAAGVFWQGRRSDVKTPINAVASQEEAKKGMVAEEIGKVESKEKAASVIIGAKETVAKSDTPVASAKGLKVEDQAAGSSVQILSIDAKEILWAAVRELKDGKIGNILGAQKVFVGDGQKVSIELLRPTVAGGTYLVVLYRDIGASSFNHKEDVMIEGVGGKFVAK